MKILFASTMFDPNVWLNLLNKALPECEIIQWQEGAPNTGADIAIVWSPPEKLFIQEPQIRAVFNMGAGVDAIFKLDGLSKDTVIVRLEDAGMAVQMAEYAVHALTNVARDFDLYQQLQDQTKWEPQPDMHRSRWPVGVLGMGKIGTCVAETFVNLGYPVSGWARSERNIPGVKCFYGQDQFKDFLASSRVLINVLPLTPETENILNKDTFNSLLPESYLISMGRGEHLVEEDLTNAIDKGKLIGATLDVFRQEPLPQSHPYWKNKRIRITPHIAAASLPEETVAQIADKIKQYAANQTVSGIVDRSRGY